MSTLAALRRQADVEIRLTVRRFGEALNPLVFFAATVALFPMGLSPEPERMAGYAAGVLWVATLLAVLFAQARQFRAEAYNGVLEQIGTEPASAMAVARRQTHGTVAGAGGAADAAGAGLRVRAEPAAAGHSDAAAGTGARDPDHGDAWAASGAALTVHAHQGGALLTVLVLPMLVPVLIFGARATEFAANGTSPDGALLWLGMLAVPSVTLGPFAVAFALRTNLD